MLMDVNGVSWILIDFDVFLDSDGCWMFMDFDAL